MHIIFTREHCGYLLIMLNREIRIYNSTQRFNVIDFNTGEVIDVPAV
jgi:hypothetical protein